MRFRLRRSLGSGTLANVEVWTLRIPTEQVKRRLGRTNSIIALIMAKPKRMVLSPTLSYLANTILLSMHESWSIR